MTTPPSFSAVLPAAPLSKRVAEALSAEIRSGRLKPGDKLPTEPELVKQFSVSRTVVREAVSRLKSIGLIDSRQGSGVFVLEAALSPLSFDASDVVSKNSVIQMVELRRALEAEVADLAALRRASTDVTLIRQALVALNKAVADGGDGVQQDVAFHLAIANAAKNPYLLSTLQYLRGFLHGATRVTRANEAQRGDFAREARAEHDSILAAIEASDPLAARAAAFNHMNNAIRRIEEADPAFWHQEGAVLARALMNDLGADKAH